MSDRSPAIEAASHGRTGGAQRRGDRAAVQDRLADAEPAQRDLRRRRRGARPQPAAREPLGRGDQRDAVGDPQAEDGDGGGARAGHEPTAATAGSAAAGSVASGRQCGLASTVWISPMRRSAKPASQ